MLGYSPEEVVSFLDATAKLWERVQKREKELTDKIATLEEQVRAWEAREADLERMRELALTEASKIREEATKQGEEILSQVQERAKSIQSETEQWLGTVLTEVEEIERRKSNFVTAFRSALESHYEILKSEEAKQESLASRLSSYLKGQKGEVSTGLLS